MSTTNKVGDFYTAISEQFNLERSDVKSEWLLFGYTYDNYENFQDEMEAFCNILKLKIESGILKTKSPN